MSERLPLSDWYSAQYEMKFQGGLDLEIEDFESDMMKRAKHAAKHSKMLNEAMYSDEGAMGMVNLFKRMGG